MYIYIYIYVYIYTETLVEDLNNTNKSWDMLKEYYDELRVISEQDWLTFSVNVYALQVYIYIYIYICIYV
jgi:hypothetical protein